MTYPQITTPWIAGKDVAVRAGELNFAEQPTAGAGARDVRSLPEGFKW